MSAAGKRNADPTGQQTMSEEKIQDYATRVTDILKVFRHRHGFGADLVCVNSETIGTEAFDIMKDILDDRKIAIEVDDGVPVGKFMFISKRSRTSNAL